jgi:hypothetical protein
MRDRVARRSLSHAALNTAFVRPILVQLVDPIRIGR